MFAIKFILRPQLPRIVANKMKLSTYKPVESYSNLETLQVTTPGNFVYRVELNRPDKRNAMNSKMWFEIKSCFSKIALDPECRSVILSGNGKHFCAGIDLFDFKASFDAFSEESSDVARRAFKIRELVSNYQQCLSEIENCRKPVIAAIHGFCIGGAIDMISSADVRYCTEDANFHIKEADLGLAADTGTIQRLSKAIGNHSLFRELVYTARPFDSTVATTLGMVSRVFPDRDILLQAVEDLAIEIASKSPVATQTAKASLIYSRDHSVAEGLRHVADWNMVMLQTEDLPTAIMSMMQKSKPDFSKL